MGLNQLRAHVAIALIIFMTIYNYAEGQLFGFRRCPDVILQSGLNRRSLRGTWYEQRRYPSFTEKGFTCVSYTLTGPPDRSPNTLTIIGVKPGRQGPLTINGAVELNDDRNSFTANFPPINFFPNNYDVIGYSSGKWVVLYSCTQYFTLSLFQVHILTADRIPPESYIEEAKATIGANKLSVSFLKRIDQTKCTGLPFFPPSASVP